MAGTVAGGLKARDANLAKDPDHYRKIGRVGGTNGRTGGFYNNPELARRAGARGGFRSKRKPYTPDADFIEIYCTSKSVHEVSERTGLAVPSVYSRVKLIRQRGTDLPPLEKRSPVLKPLVTHIDVAEETSQHILTVRVLRKKKPLFSWLGKR